MKYNYIKVLEIYCSFLYDKVECGTLTYKTYMDYTSVVGKLEKYLLSLRLDNDSEYIDEIKNWNNSGKNIVITDTIKKQIILVNNVLEI